MTFFALFRPVWFFLFTILFFSAAQAETISLRADIWYPMNGVAGSAQPGYMVEIADKIFAAAGHKLDYQTMPWTQALQQANAGQIDCVAGAYKEDAPDFIYPDEPLGLDVEAFYVRADQSWRFTGDFNALDDIDVAVVAGYAYDEEFMQYLKKRGDHSHIVAVNTDNALEVNLRKVMSGKVVATIESISVVEAKIKNMGLEGKIIAAGKVGKPNPMYIACSPAKASSGEYVRLLSEGIRNMRKSGELASVLKKYGLKDWK